MYNISSKIIRAEEFSVVSEKVHELCFGEKRIEELNKYHFVIGSFIEDNFMGYSTCLEMDSETVYMQFGGVMPKYKKSHYVYSAYVKGLEVLKEHYKRAWTRIENKNKPMLKLALQVGFDITGIYNNNGKIFVELTHSFGG